MEYLTYKKFKTREEATCLIENLESNNVPYQLEDISPVYDITYTGGTELEDKIALKIKDSDFDVVDHILEKIAENNMYLIEKDHYLYEFSNMELIEILEKYDEWSKTDYLAARKILKERGKAFSDNEIQKFKEKRIEKLSQPEKGNTGWLIFGFISAVMGGLLGIFIGHHHCYFKKQLPTGERVYAYNELARRIGFKIYSVGIISFIFWVILWLITFNKI